MTYFPTRHPASWATATPAEAGLDPEAVAAAARECLGAVVSNGRVFYTSQASGFVVSQTYGEESKKLPAAR